MSGLFPPEGIADIEATLASFFAGGTVGDQWRASILESRAAAIAYYAPERMTDGTWNLYLRQSTQSTKVKDWAVPVQQVEQDLLQASARVLLIETSGVPDFAGQRAFYVRLGYHEEARIREFYAPGDDKVVYWENLATRAQPALPLEQPRSV